MGTVAEHKDAEVLIVGAGPAGSTLAALLAMGGHRVIVVERESFPRFHVGESLLPRSCEVFEKLGLGPRLDRDFLRKYGATFVCSDTGRQETFLFSEAFESEYPYAYQVPRAEFDHMLLVRAVELGAEVRQSWEVTSILFEGSRAVGVRACPSGDRGAGTIELRAPVVVDGSGRGSLMASRLGGTSRLPGLDKTALFTHYRGAGRDLGRAEGNISIVIFKHGWMWFIPFRGDLTSVGIVMSRDRMREKSKDESLEVFFDRNIELSPWSVERLAGARRERPVMAAADFSYGVDRIVGDGWLCVGDASGFIDPLFSTGAHMAIKGADLAAGAIHGVLSGAHERETFSQYEGAVRSAGDMFLGVVQAFYDGDFRHMLFEPNQRRHVRQIITSMLSGDVVHHGRTPTWARFLRQRFPARREETLRGVANHGGKTGMVPADG